MGGVGGFMFIWCCWPCKTGFVCFVSVIFSFFFLLAWYSIHLKCREGMALTAVWAVTWVHPTILAPANGFSPWAAFLKAISAVISLINKIMQKCITFLFEYCAMLICVLNHTVCLPSSASSISRRPKSASLMFLMQKSLLPLELICCMSRGETSSSGFSASEPPEKWETKRECKMGSKIDENAKNYQKYKFSSLREFVCHLPELLLSVEEWEIEWDRERRPVFVNRLSNSRVCSGYWIC